MNKKDPKKNRLLLVILINIIITISQIIGGFFSGSLALLSDALHNFSDVLSLVTTYIAKILFKKKSSIQKTYGYKRAEIMAALFNSSLLFGIGLLLIKEAVEKIITPTPISSPIVIWLALLSIFLNFLSVIILHKDSHKNLNIKSVYLHLLSDVITSFAVFFGGLGIYFYNIFWFDPFITILIALYLIFASWKILKESVSILMNFSPTHIEIKDIAKLVTSLPQIKNIHHIHLWQLNETDTYLEAHIELEKDINARETTKILSFLIERIKKNFNITHITLQPEYKSFDIKDLVIKE